MATISQLQRIHTLALWLKSWRLLLIALALLLPVAMAFLLMFPYSPAQELWLQATVATEVGVLFLLFTLFLMQQLPVWPAVTGFWPRLKQGLHQSWYRLLVTLWWLVLLVCLYLFAKTAKSVLAFYLT